MNTLASGIMLIKYMHYAIIIGLEVFKPGSYFNWKNNPKTGTYFEEIQEF
jgi:hypothetical protein